MLNGKSIIGRGIYGKRNGKKELLKKKNQIPKL
jgi:hypothetical protein